MNSKMEYCKVCGAEMASNAKACPKCGAKNKKPIYKKWWFWVLAIIIIGSIAGGKSTDRHTAVNGTNSNGEKIDMPEVEIAEQVIYSGNDVTLTATGIEKSGKDYKVNLLIENNSALNLGFNAHAYAINGIMTRNNIYDMDYDVAAGKKVNATLELKGRVLSEYGITSIRCIDVLFWAYDNDKYFKAFDTDQVEIQTNLFDSTHDAISGENIFENQNISVDFLSGSDNKYDFVITNKTGAYFDFDFDEITINNYTVSDMDYDLYDETLLNNSQIVCTVEIDSEFIKENGIESIETIEWNLDIRPGGDYTNSYKIGPVQYTVK